MSNGNQIATIQRIRTLADELKAPAAQERLRDAMLDTMSPARMVGVALTAASRNPMLAQCSTSSIALALMQAGSYGLEPNGRDGHLVPYRNRKTNSVDCQFIPDYKGLIKLALQNPRVRSVAAECVFSNDEFDVSFGSEQHLHHRPCFADRGTFTAVWALAKLANGAEIFKVLTASDVAKHRAKAQSDNVWRDWFEAMACKTAVKSLAKFLPLGGTFEAAVSYDDALDVESVETPASNGRRRSRRRSAAALADTAEALSRPDNSMRLADPDFDAAPSEPLPPSDATESPAAARAAESKPKRKRAVKPAPEAAGGDDGRTLKFTSGQSVELQAAVDRGAIPFEEFRDLKAQARQRFGDNPEQTIDEAFAELKLRLLAAGDVRDARPDQRAAIGSLLSRFGDARADYEAKAMADYDGLAWDELNVAQADHFLTGLKAAVKAKGSELF